ncbi:MAG TPA: rhodanese-like domain-containing protein [Candidatus Acidoferrales bacterium]
MDEAKLDDLQITPQAVKEKMEAKDKFLLLDVREKWEAKMAQIPGSMLVPMQEIPENLGVIEGAQEVIVYCHLGIRSLDVTVWLRQQGIENSRSIAGGIDRWSREIDASIPRYD